MDSSVPFIALSYLLVLISVIIKGRRKPVVLLDPAWAIVIGYFINYCVKPVLFLVSPQSSTMYTDLGDTLAMSHNVNVPMVMAITFFASFMMTNIFGQHAVSPASRPGLDRMAYVMRSPWAAILLALMIGGGLVSVLLFVREVNWSGTLTELLAGDARTLMLRNNLGKGYYVIGMHLSQLAWCMYALRLSNRRPAIPGVASFIITSVLFGIAMLVPLILGQRFGMIIIIVGALIIFDKQLLSGGKRSLKMRYVVAGMAAIFLISGPIGVVLKGMPVTPSNIVLMSTSAWDSFELHSQMIPDGEQHLLYGLSYAEDIFYSYLPRLWFDKPERYGIRKVQDMVAPSLSRSPGTFPPGMVLEAYFNFGWVGLVIVPALLGLLSIAVTERLKRGDTYWTLQAVFIFLGSISFRGVGNVFSQVCFQWLVVGSMVRVGYLFTRPRVLAYRASGWRGQRSSVKTYLRPDSNERVTS